MSRRIAWALTAAYVLALALVAWLEWQKPTHRDPEDHIVATALYLFGLTIALAYTWVGADDNSPAAACERRGHVINEYRAARTPAIAMGCARCHHMIDVRTRRPWAGFPPSD